MQLKEIKNRCESVLRANLSCKGNCPFFYEKEDRCGLSSIPKDWVFNEGVKPASNII